MLSNMSGRKFACPKHGTTMASEPGASRGKLTRGRRSVSRRSRFSRACEISDGFTSRRAFSTKRAGAKPRRRTKAELMFEMVADDEDCDLLSQPPHLWRRPLPKARAGPPAQAVRY